MTFQNLFVFRDSALERHSRYFELADLNDHLNASPDGGRRHDGSKACDDPPLLQAREAGAGGALIGIGICMLFNSGASLGGSTVLALYIHRRFGRDPGKTVFAIDLAVILTSLSAVSLSGALISGLSLAITGTVVSRYTGRQNASPRHSPGQSSATAAAGA